MRDDSSLRGNAPRRDARRVRRGLASSVYTSRATKRAAAAQIGALFDEHAGMVLGLCRLLLRNHHDAEDAAQQTFVSAYRSLLRGNEPREPAAWLAAIARNEARARLRKRLRSPLAFEADVGEDMPHPDDLTEVASMRAEFAELRSAMADLPIRQREAIALRDFLGLSYEEVASTLSVSVPVVESLLFRARRRLRETVRTIPRYAAGLASVPLALRLALEREVPGLEGAGSVAGLAGAGAGAAGAGIVTKLVSLPFATKAATAVVVVAAGTAVAPTIGGSPAETSAPTPTTIAGQATPAPERSGTVAAAPDAEPAVDPSVAPEAVAPDPGSEPSVAESDASEPVRAEAIATPAEEQGTSPDPAESPAEPSPDRSVTVSPQDPAPADTDAASSTAPCEDTSQETGRRSEPEASVDACGPAENTAGDTLETAGSDPGLYPKAHSPADHSPAGPAIWDPAKLAGDTGFGEAPVGVATSGSGEEQPDGKKDESEPLPD